LSASFKKFKDKRRSANMALLSVTVTKSSAWDFVTFGSGGIGLGYFAAEGGTIVLKNPSTGIDESFYYGGAGVGLSAGLKLPKIGKVQINTRKGPLTGAGGPTAFPSTGTVMVTDACPGADLTTSDIQGLCCFTEVGGGLIVGGSAAGMYVGLDAVRLAAFAASALPFGSSLASQFLLASAKAIILMAGINAGLQAQIGGAVYMGYLH
jgi:hypothetical protein